MGNSLRCCLACVLPCGALDLIRIVHLNGYVEEITGPITAGEVLKANPNHVLSKPTSQGVVRRWILILLPETELKRGSIYFLIPSSSLPPEKTKQRSSTKADASSKKKSNKSDDDSSSQCSRSCTREVVADVLVSGGEKKASRRERRHSRSGVFRPYLESISED